MMDSSFSLPLFLVAQLGHHVVQFVERDEPAAMASLVGVDGVGELGDFGTCCIGCRLELAAFWSTGSGVTRSTAIDECARVLFDESLHYDGSAGE